jgi:hypothetical protein
MIKFDVPCKCSFFTSKGQVIEKVFDLEMQRTFQSSFADRLFKYGSRLKIANPSSHIVVLAFLSEEMHRQDESSWITQFRREIENGWPIKPIEGMDIHCVDLSKQVEKLRENKPIIIAGRVLREIGREWVKLLCIRHWACKLKSEDPRCHRYIIPKQSASDSAVQSALKILEQYTEDDFEDCIRSQQEQEDAIQTARNEGVQEGFQKGHKEGFGNGHKEGVLKEKMNTITQMRNCQMTDKEIEAIIGMSPADLT